MLSDNERKIVLAVGQTMFPRDSVLGIDADDAGVVDFVEDYVGRMPPFPRGQIRALLNTFEYGYAAWSGRPRDSFTAARPADRAAYLESWERSTSYMQRQLYEALRAVFTFAYVDAPCVQAAIRGIEPGPESRSESQTAKSQTARAAEEA